MTAEADGAVHLRVEGAVATIVFDRPHARNAMTWAMYDALAAALARIDEARAVRVAVLRGAGGASFIAGTAIEQFAAFRSGEDGVAYEARIEAVIDGLERLRVPTIAVVEGMAVGGGLVIAAACDLRVATVGARFGVPIARTLGNCLSAANLRRLVGVLGLPVVKRMLLAAELLPAEALAGFLAAVVEPAAVDAATAALCDRLAAHAPLTLAATRAMLRALATDPRPADADAVREVYGSRDFAEGVRAFTAKRPAAWTGD